MNCVRRIREQRVEKVIHDGLPIDFGLEREKNPAYRGTRRNSLSVSGSRIPVVTLRGAAAGIMPSHSQSNLGMVQQKSPSRASAPERKDSRVSWGKE